MAARCAAHHNPGGEAMPTKTPEKKASGGKANALQKPLQPSEELAAVIGSGPLPRGQVVSKMWEYIRSHNLQVRWPREPPRLVAGFRLRRGASIAHQIRGGVRSGPGGFDRPR